MDVKEIFQNLTRGVNFKRKLLQQNEQNKKSKGEPVKENQNGKGCNVKNAKLHEFDNDFECIKLDNDKIGTLIDKKKKTMSIKQKVLLKQIEEVNHLRKLHNIKVAGKNIPEPLKSFDLLLDDEYQVPQQLVNNLKTCEFFNPTPVQMQAIPIMLKGLSVMCCAPTGSGKTVAFLIPIIRDLKQYRRKGIRALVLCPTRELAKQTYRESLRLTENIAVKIHLISKTKNIEDYYSSEKANKFDILITTPNRVRFLLEQDPKLINLTNVEWLVIDEADKLLEDGENKFKEQFEDIFNACSSLTIKIALFSATYTGLVAKWAVKNLKFLVRVTIGERNSATNAVEQELLFVGNESGKLLAIREMLKSGMKPPILIFVQSKERAKQLYSELLYDEINVDVIHADRSQTQRDDVVKSFREGKIWILICTELMGRGIDFKGVNLVINYDFPSTNISYIHRIGRAGRAGRKGKAITFFTQDDQTNLRSIAHIIKNSGGHVPQFMLTLKKAKKLEKKNLANSAPSRDDITITPKFFLEKRKENQMKNKRNFENKATKKQQSFKDKLILGKF